MVTFYDALKIEYGSCPPDCTLCEEACVKERGGGRQNMGRIKVIHLSEFHGALTCIQCGEPDCLEVCPPYLLSNLSPNSWSISSNLHMAALERAMCKLDEIDQEFGERFDRRYGGQIEEYRTEDADIVMLTMGDFTGTTRVVIDQKRDEGIKVGLVKVRLFRPFPQERLIEVLRGKKAVGVVDRNVCFGWDSGTLAMETKAALGDARMTIPVTSFIGGLHGGDLIIPRLHKAVDITNQAAQGQPFQKTTWLDLEE